MAHILTPTSQRLNIDIQGVEVCSHLNLVKHQQNWNMFPIMHHIYVDINPPIHNNNGYFIYIDNNKINFENNRHCFGKDHVMHGFYNLLITTVRLML